MKSILNIVGGVMIAIGTILLALMILTPCGNGVGQCGDKYLPLIGVALAAIGVAAVIKGSAS